MGLRNETTQPNEGFQLQLPQIDDHSVKNYFSPMLFRETKLADLFTT